MSVSEELMTLGAVSVELGAPIALAVLYWRRPQLRSKVVVVLGAVTPLLLAYIVILVGFLIDPQDPGNRFSFYAGPVMSFVAYLGCLALGIGMSFIPWPQHLALRYILGALAVVALGTFLLGGRRAF